MLRCESGKERKKCEQEKGNKTERGGRGWDKRDEDEQRQNRTLLVINPSLHIFSIFFSYQFPRISKEKKEVKKEI